MATLGTGVIPSGAVGTELTYVTRRAFIPMLVVQLYQSSPLLAVALANAQPASGGVSSVTVPLQGSAYVAGQWTDYSGTFNQPAVLNGTNVAEFNLKAMIVPVPFLGMEGLVQQDHAIIPLIHARMNDATNVQADLMATALYNNFANNQQFIGLPGAIDDGTNLVTYGGVNRTTNTYWKAKVRAMGSVSPTRYTIMQNIAGTFQNGGEVPNFGIMGIATWTTLSNDFIANEQYRITPSDNGFDDISTGPRSVFRALMVAGIPIYVDPYAPEGQLFLINTNYFNLYIHDRANFNFTGFYSTIPNYQIGFVGAVVTLGELVVTKPKTCGRFTGYTNITI